MNTLWDVLRGWHEHAKELKGEPEYDGGYGDALYNSEEDVKGIVRKLEALVTKWRKAPEWAELDGTLCADELREILGHEVVYDDPIK